MSAVRIQLVALACVLLPVESKGRAQQPAENPSAADESTLKHAGLSTDDAALLRLVRERTLSDAEMARLRGLIKQLGDKAYQLRQKASKELVSAGRPVVPLLNEALKDADLEVASRVKRCLEQIELKNDTPVVLAAVRLLAARKPAGAVETLLAYAPFVVASEVEEEVVTTLAALGLQGGKAEEAAIKALTDEAAARRAAGVAVVARSADTKQRQAAHALLKDVDARVRWRATQGLFLARDQRSIPALIELLHDSPLNLAWQAEELLGRLAGEKAPTVGLGHGTAELRQKARLAWTAWYQAEGVKLNLAKLDLDNRQLGFTLCVAWSDDKTKFGRVFEIDRDGRERWSIDDVNHPVDGQLLRGQRVLIAEQSGRRVTERDLKGKILWEYKVQDSLTSCKRLSNGNTWIVSYYRIAEVAPDGREVFGLSLQGKPHGWISHAEKLRGGNIAYLAYGNGHVITVNAKGSQLRSIPVDRGEDGLVKFEALPNGNILIPQQGQHKVQELDAAGKVVWSCNVSKPNSATRLPGGRTLVSSYSRRRVVEVDRAGGTVWEQRLNAGLLNASRR